MFGKVKESEQHLNINWKHFYLSVLALVIPMALQNLINVGVTAADVVMLGKVGEHALSGASLAGQVQYIMTLFLFGLTSGATVLTAQYWGKKDICTIEKILGLGMRSAVIVTAVFFVAAQCIPHTLMKIFTSDPEVIEQGVVYLRIVSWSYIFMGITQTYLYIMRSVERVVVATVVYLCSLICNVGINAVLIFGLFGMPALGVKGAAIGTLTARLLEMALVCLYSHFWNKDIKFHTKYFLHTEKVLNRDFLKYAFPVILNEVLWGLGTAANTACLGIWEVQRLRQTLWRKWQDSLQQWLHSVWQVRRQFILERQSGRKNTNMQKPMRAGRMAQCTDGSARWNLNPCDCSVYGGGDDIVRDCQMYMRLCFLLCLIL